MNTLTAPSPVQLPARAPAAARTVFRLLQQLRHGSLTIELPDGSVQTVGDGQGPHISIHMRNWNAFGAASSRVTSALPKATSPATGPRPIWPVCSRCCWPTARRSTT